MSARRKADWAIRLKSVWGVDSWARARWLMWRTYRAWKPVAMVRWRVFSPMR